ncbi:hypothetical protein PROFUN_14851, partial [Planoprotostelium fungivorum]
TLRDAAHKTINSRDPNHRHWWRHKKQLPIHNREVVRWWMANVRESVWEEARDAAQRDDVDVLDLLGWDDTQLSPRHRNLCRPGWRRESILLEALVKGSKRTINAYHQSGDISGVPAVECLSKMNLWPRLGEEGNLKMIQWLYNQQSIGGLPSVTWPNRILGGSYLCLRPAAKAGHKHVISWFKERGDIDEHTSLDIRYKGAAEGGRLDILTWLEDNGFYLDDDLDSGAALADFAQSLAVFEWAVKRSLPGESGVSVYEEAVSAGCTEVMRYCVENQFDLPIFGSVMGFPVHDENCEAIQLAVNHGYITNETDLTFESTDEQFELIRWMHERDVLHPELSVYNVQHSLMKDSYIAAVLNDNLDILQWAAEKGYLTDTNIYQNGSPETIEWLMRKPMEWMLQRKWNKRQDEVQRWFQREDIKREWLMHLWEHGIDISLPTVSVEKNLPKAVYNLKYDQSDALEVKSRRHLLTTMSFE